MLNISRHQADHELTAGPNLFFHASDIVRPVGSYLIASIISSILCSTSPGSHAFINALLQVIISGQAGRRYASVLVLVLLKVFEHHGLFGLEWCWTPCRQEVSSEEDDSNNRVIASTAKPPNTQDIGRDVLPPLLFISRTTHRRFFPKPHSFNYSYLMAGIPVTANRSQRLLPSISINSEDYLQRNSNFSFRTKLDNYLHTRNIGPEIYPYVYLVTAPRVLGFSFNPVNFWYLYTKNMTFSAMILEVNNTLGERRLYYLQPEHESNNNSQRFIFTWNKDFHVSPFNYHIDTDESYSVTTIDIHRTRKLDVTIVLRQGTDKKPKIVSRVFSEQVVDPAKLTAWQKVLFLLQYGWIGYLTEPRILLQARKLWMKSLKVFVWPEPLQETMPRAATASEDMIEAFFRDMLREVAKKNVIPIVYRAAAGTCLGVDQLFEYEKQGMKTRSRKEALQIHVLTPAFYAELGKTNSSIEDVFEQLCLNAPPGVRMVWTNDHARMRAISTLCEEFSRSDERRIVPCSGYGKFLFVVRSTVVDGWLSALKDWITISYPAISSDSCTAFDRCVAKLSDDDSGYCKIPGAYLWAVANILLAGKVTFGSEALPSGLKSMLRFVVTIGLTSVIVKALTQV